MTKRAGKTDRVTRLESGESRDILRSHAYFSKDTRAVADRVVTRIENRKKNRGDLFVN